MTDHDAASRLQGVRVIGYITRPEAGCALISRDGQEFPLKAQGWNAFTPATDDSAPQES